MSSQEEATKLTDDEKFELIEFYKLNLELWATNRGTTKTQKLLKKEELCDEFDGKFKIEALEKIFHGLRASCLREKKKYKDGNLPKKQWKFYESMLFLKEDPVVKRC